MGSGRKGRVGEGYWEILLILSKNQLLVSLICSTVFFVVVVVVVVLTALINALIFVISWLLFWGFICCSFSSSLRRKVRLCIWDLYSFFRKVWIAMYFPLMTAFAASQRFRVVVLPFSLTSIYFLTYSLTAWLAHSFFSRMFFSLQKFLIFPIFSCGWFWVS